jgi:ribosome maturation factor RimP
MENMFDKIKVNIEPYLDKMNIIIDAIYLEKKGKIKNLIIVLDNETGIDLDLIVEASRKINKVIDQMDIPLEDYVLDIMSKEKGKNE